MQNLKIAAAHIRTRRNGQDIENFKFKATSIHYKETNREKKKEKGKTETTITKRWKLPLEMEN